MNAGVCDHCWAVAPRRIITASWSGNSGPGGAQWGCIPCARALAASPNAPTWLRYRIEALDTDTDTPPARCEAAHQDDPTPCTGPRAAGVTGATIAPGPEHTEGDSIRAYKLGQRGETV